MSVKQRQEGEMDDRDLDGPNAAELAHCEAELPEWDRLRVRDYWEAVVSEELGEDPVPEEREPTDDFQVLSSDDPAWADVRESRGNDQVA
jgi:hypothetical protein